MHGGCPNGIDFAGDGGAPNAVRTNKRKVRADARKLTDSSMMNQTARTIQQHCKHVGLLGVLDNL